MNNEYVIIAYQLIIIGLWILVGLLEVRLFLIRKDKENKSE